MKAVDVYLKAKPAIDTHPYIIISTRNSTFRLTSQNKAKLSWEQGIICSHDWDATIGGGTHKS